LGDALRRDGCSFVILAWLFDDYIKFEGIGHQHQHVTAVTQE